MNVSPRRRALPRVLHVMESTIGGTRRHLVDVVGGLAERGYPVGVVAAERQPDFREDLARLAAAGVHVRELPLSRAIRPGRDLAHGRALLREIEGFRPDVVHTHSSKAGVLGRLASWIAGRGALSAWILRTPSAPIAMARNDRAFLVSEEAGCGGGLWRARDKAGRAAIAPCLPATPSGEKGRCPGARCRPCSGPPESARRRPARRRGHGPQHRDRRRAVRAHRCA